MTGKQILRRARPLAILILVIWVVEVVNLVLGYRLNQWFGLYPRDAWGLIGIVTMPFLHDSIAHAAANTVPLVILGSTVLVVAPKRFRFATIAIVAATGFAVWLLARPGTVHVGASGLVFGWFGFVMALGFIERSIRAILGAAVVFLIYSGMIWGAIPSFNMEISWEAHLFGALAGAGIAYLLGRKRR